MTSTTDRAGARPHPGGPLARLSLVLAVVAAALGLIVVRSEPANAWTIRRSANEIVLTSERLHDLTVRANVVVTLRRDGDVILRAHEVHNSGATRKFYRVEATVNIPVIGLEIYMLNPWNGTYRRIGGDSTHSNETKQYYQKLYDEWDLVSSHTIDASLRLNAKRVYVP